MSGGQKSEGKSLPEKKSLVNKRPGDKSPGNKSPGKKVCQGKKVWGTKVLQRMKVHLGTKVRETNVLGTKVLFHWVEDKSPGTQVLISKVRGRKVLQPGMDFPNYQSKYLIDIYIARGFQS